MENSGKRRHDTDGFPNSKKSKGSHQGKWMTPGHQAKKDLHRGQSLDVGDVGIWVTCQRGKEGRAADEVTTLCEEYGRRLFGLQSDDDDDSGHGEGGDIEASIEKEVAALKQKQTASRKDKPFEIIKMSVDCLLFVRTRPPVDPVVLVQEIVKDAATTDDKAKWRSRFINKLTPILVMGKASEKGLDELVRTFLSDHFRLSEVGADDVTDKEEKLCSYAIRPNIRIHQTLQRDEVINKVAKMISKRHHVNLTAPDKVIIIEIFQSLCGMSVLGNDWEPMKRYNVHELNAAALKAKRLGEKDRSRAAVKQDDHASEESNPT